MGGEWMVGVFSGGEFVVSESVVMSQYGEGGSIW